MLTAASQRIQLASPWLLLVLLSSALSFAVVRWPVAATAAAVVLVLIIMTARALSGLRFWQQITILCLSSYITLGYGFTNLTLPGVPVPVGHLLMSTGLLLALPGRKADLRAFLQEPVAWCWLALLALTVLHWITDIPRYGIWAVRDSSFVVEGVFLLSGFLWARQRLALPSMVRNLLPLFVINLAYALTYPVADSLLAISPRSGVFLSVPLIGTYWVPALTLVFGGVFIFLFGRDVFKLPPVVVGSLALLQLAWSLVFQMRVMYIGMALVPIILGFSGERRKAAIMIAGIALSLALALGAGTLGIAPQGRIGDLTPEFFVQHLRSILLVPDTPSVGTTQWRVDLVPQMLERWRASTTTTLIGEGFGEPLTSWEISPLFTEIGEMGTGVQVRSPHNTHLTTLVRLGFIGLMLWALMHARIAYLLIRGVRTAPRGTLAHGFAVWILTFYGLGIVFTSAEPWFEFALGAIPFYTLIGFAIGLPSAAPVASSLDSAVPAPAPRMALLLPGQHSG